MRSPATLVASTLLLAACALGGGVARADGSYPDLRERHDDDLQELLEETLRERMQPAFWKALREKRAGIVVADVTDVSEPEVAGFNPDRMLYAASLPKIAIFLGVLVEIERGNMKNDEATRSEATRMIRLSSNPAASNLLRRVGFENLAEILQSDRYRLYDPRHGGGLWVGRAYDKSPVWKRDPIHGISHGATAMQVARYYYMAITGQLASWKYRPMMREVFGDSPIQHKIVKGLRERPDAVVGKRKSGTWRHFHADSGIIERRDHRYIVAILLHDPDADEDIPKLIVAIDDATYAAREKHR